MHCSCISDVKCPKGLVYDECHVKLDDFCYRGFAKSIWSLLNKNRHKKESAGVLKLCFSLSKSLLGTQSEDFWCLTEAQECRLFLSRRQI